MVADRSTSDRLHNRGGVRAATRLAECRSVSALHIPVLLVASAAVKKGNIRNIAVAECRCPQLFIRRYRKSALAARLVAIQVMITGND